MDTNKTQPFSFDGKIHLIISDQQLETLSTELKNAKELGFDTETKPSFVKGDVHKVALLQLATESEAYLIRLHRISKFEIIKEILENSEIVKIGVAIRDDLKQLQKLFKFEPKNFIELQALAKEKGLKNFGLKGMAEEALQVTVTKGPKLTNWEAHTLTDQQLKYAATDAWIGLKLFQKTKKLSCWLSFFSCGFLFRRLMNFCINQNFYFVCAIYVCTFGVHNFVTT